MLVGDHRSVVTNTQTVNYFFYLIVGPVAILSLPALFLVSDPVSWVFLRVSMESFRH